MEKKQPLSVLIAPLDWGLGHATRCIPIIKCFLRSGCIVYVATTPVIKQLLIQEFPHHVCFLPLKGYAISYSRSKRNFAIKILLQIPKIFFAIKHEHQWLKKVVVQHKIRLVISDNRYGLFHKKVPSVFITHQLQIQSPFRLMQGLLLRMHYRFINRFIQCWVPDFQSEQNVAGVLSHPSHFPAVPVIFIGPLSRFSRTKKSEIQYKWLFVLSGPEPQRSILEEIVCKLIPKLEGNILLLRGLPDTRTSLYAGERCIVFNHFPTNAMQRAFEESEFVVSRSGYTTVMEIIGLQKKSILIPTPGQTEQEYLAAHLMQQQWCYCCSQHEDLLQHFSNAQSFSYTLPAFQSTSLQQIITKTIEDVVDINR